MVRITRFVSDFPEGEHAGPDITFLRHRINSMLSWILKNAGSDYGQDQVTSTQKARRAAGLAFLALYHRDYSFLLEFICKDNGFVYLLLGIRKLNEVYHHQVLECLVILYLSHSVWKKDESGKYLGQSVQYAKLALKEFQEQYDSVAPWQGSLMAKVVEICDAQMKLQKNVDLYSSLKQGM